MKGWEMKVQVELRKNIKPIFYIHDWHLAFTTRFKDVDACYSMCFGWVVINLWDKKWWGCI